MTRPPFSRRLHDWLHELPTTSWLITSGTLAAWATSGVYLGAILLEKSVDPVAFGAWLAFLSGWMGLGVRQFRVKRETDHQALQIKHQSGGGHGRASSTFAQQSTAEWEGLAAGGPRDGGVRPAG